MSTWRGSFISVLKNLDNTIQTYAPSQAGDIVLSKLAFSKPMDPCLGFKL